MKESILRLAWNLAVFAGLPSWAPAAMARLDDVWVASLPPGPRSRIHAARRVVEEMTREARGDDWGPMIGGCRLEPVTPAEREAQRRSFAYGNTALSNPNITREMIDAAADTIPAPVPVPTEPWDLLVGDGPLLDVEAAEEHAAMVDLHDPGVYVAPNGRGWEA